MEVIATVRLGEGGRKRWERQVMGISGTCPDLCGVSEMSRNCQVLLNLFRQPSHESNLIRRFSSYKLAISNES